MQRSMKRMALAFVIALIIVTLLSTRQRRGAVQPPAPATAKPNPEVLLLADSGADMPLPPVGQAPAKDADQAKTSAPVKAKQEATKKDPLTAKKEAASLRAQAGEVLKATPAEEGEDRATKLKRTIELLEMAKTVIDQVDDPAENLRVVIPSELASAQMRFVVGADQVNHFLVAVEEDYAAHKKLDAADVEFKKNTLFPLTKEETKAKAAYDKAAEDSTLAIQKIGVIADYAQAAGENFKLTVERIRQSSDKRLGPNSPLILVVLRLHEKLLDAEVKARRRMLDLFAARHADPKEVEKYSRLSSGVIMHLHGVILTVGLEARNEELKTIRDQIANFGKVQK